MSADYLKRELVSHTRQVCSLYRRMTRNVEYWKDDFLEARLKKLVLRAQFDNNKYIKEVRVAKALLNKAETKFNKEAHPYYVRGPPLHPYYKEGIAYQRNLESPDYVMDYYHPLEKAQYPYYLAKREQMIKEYMDLWKKNK